jgi:hypothetical protein
MELRLSIFHFAAFVMLCLFRGSRLLRQWRANQKLEQRHVGIYIPTLWIGLSKPIKSRNSPQPCSMQFIWLGITAAFYKGTGQRDRQVNTRSLALPRKRY